MKTIAIGEVRNGDIHRYVDHFKFDNEADAKKFQDNFNKVYAPANGVPAIARPSRYLMAFEDSRPLR